MRCYLAVWVLALSSAATPAVDKKPEVKPMPDPKVEKLVGTWALTHFDGDPAEARKQTNTFKEDGSMAATFLDRQRMEKTKTGVYSIHGTELHLNYDADGGKPASKGFVYIEELTDDRLVVVAPKSDGGSRLAFKRVRDKK